jgi:hypothetical protein
LENELQLYVHQSRAESLIWANYSSMIIVVKTLAKHVGAQLGERAFCVIFEDDLERCWPLKDMSRSERETGIQSFAESQGWSAAILEGGFGTRAIFQTLTPASVC